MDKQDAIKIIRDTFERPFDRRCFTYFVKNLLNNIESEDKHPYSGKYIPDAYKPFISTLKRIGKYRDSDDNKIDILIVHLKKQISLERARTMQRNFIAWYLKGSRGDILKDAALVAYVSPAQEDWRFSLVKMEYKLTQTESGRLKAKEELTPARRFSFLVGKNEPNHTAQLQLYPLLKDDINNPTLTQLEDAFNIETVTREFFENYRDLFIRIKEAMDNIINKDPAVKEDFINKGVDTVDFAKKLMGQIVFLYFLQKKGWFGVERDADWGTGSKKFLRELFEKEHGDYQNFFNDVLEHLFYDALRDDRSFNDYYYSRFNCKIPFLNGGLFDPIGSDRGYDWVHTDLLLPNELFSNQNETKEGDIGDGILDVFDRYNFTVKEDEPLEKEVAIDPELLGKAYEKFNAIRPDNFDEYKKALRSGKKGAESKFNKQYGVYYTPREIVHYMCQQSLINYLHTSVNQVLMKQPARVPRQGKLIGPKDPKQLGFQTDKEIVSKEDIQMLIKHGEQFAENEAVVIEKGKETKTYQYKIPESVRKNAKIIDEKLKEIKVCDPAVGSGAFPVGMMTEIVKTRNVLSPFIGDQDRTIYNYKHDCIQHSLYGVDIDPGAVEIAKLRLWLSLVVDEEDIEQIRPLPNLDYKIVCGNSLLGVEKDFFNANLFDKLEELKPLYFNEANASKKQRYKNQIDDLISQITNGHNDFDFEVYFSEVFHEKKGFDVVIANPPYINTNEMKDNANLYRSLYSTAYGSYDIYVLFFEKSIQLLHENAVLTFITSNKFFIADYAKKLRFLLLNDVKILKLLDLADCKQVFENVLVSPAITIIKKQKVTDYTLEIGLLKDEDFYKIDSIQLKKIKNGELSQRKSGAFDIYLNKDNQTIFKKVSYQSVSLDRIADVRTGIMGFEYWNMKQYISEGKIGKKSIRIITNSHLAKYTFLFNKKINLYKKNFNNPFINIAKAPINENTKELFQKRKIIVRGVAKELTAQIDESGYALLVAVHAILVKNIDRFSEFYILALLNSRFFNWLHLIKFYTARIPMGSLKYPVSFFKDLPIKELSKVEQKPFIELVYKILSLTQSEDYLENPTKQVKVKEYERQIDQMVYKLYGLIDDEIEVVEDSFK